MIRWRKGSVSCHRKEDHNERSDQRIADEEKNGEAAGQNETFSYIKQIYADRTESFPIRSSALWEPGEAKLTVKCEGFPEAVLKVSFV